MAQGTIETDEIKMSNMLPPMYLSFTVGCIWSVYCCLHVYPMLQIGADAEHKDHNLARKGLAQIAVVQLLFGLYLACYSRAMLTNPGTIPDTASWRMGMDNAGNLPATQQVKFTGERRHCKWCLKYKPDRCHHCRVCKRCVLKMDHHCPWIMNCVGLGNQKYFFLTVLYSALATLYIAWTMHETVLDSSSQEMPHVNRFLLVFGFVQAIFFACLMTVFGCFHVFLMFNCMTTIEFCEGRTREGPASPGGKEEGVYNKIAAVLGPHPLFWLVPVDPKLTSVASLSEAANSVNAGSSSPFATAILASHQG